MYRFRRNIGKYFSLTKKLDRHGCIFLFCEDGGGGIRGGGAYWDNASSRTSPLTIGKVATSKNTLKDTERPWVSKRTETATLERSLRLFLFIRYYLFFNSLVRVFVPDGLKLVVGRSRQNLVELPGDGRQVRRPVARVVLQDGTLKHGEPLGTRLLYNQRSRPLVVRRENAAVTHEA